MFNSRTVEAAAEGRSLFRLQECVAMSAGPQGRDVILHGHFGSTAVASISTLAPSSTRPATCTRDIAG